MLDLDCLQGRNGACAYLMSCCCLVCTGQEQSVGVAGDCGGDSECDLGGHWGTGECEEGAAGVGPVPSRAPREVPQVRNVTPKRSVTSELASSLTHSHVGLFIQK